MKIFIKGQEIALKNDLSTVYKYKGSLPDEASLPTENNAVGDVYNCEDTGNNFAWEGTKWDKLAGTVDMSNYYTKAQSDASATSIANARAAAIADEKIAAIPVNNLLHYKGHVGTVEMLPSLGQSSGSYVAPSYDYIGKAMEQEPGFPKQTQVYADYGKGRAKYYIVLSGFGTSSNHRYRPFVLYTDYPELLKICFIKISDRVYPTIKVTYNEAKPVFISFGTDSNSSPTESVLDSNAQQIMSNTVVNTIVNSDYMSFASWWANGGGYRCIEQTNIPQLALDTTYDSTYTQFWTTVNWWQEANVLKSMRDLDNDYIWTNGMNIITNDGNGWSKLVYSESLADLNDIYTVGDNYDIYRRNELPAWEQWSQGVSKDYVDSIVGGVNTELETIINGEE